MERVLIVGGGVVGMLAASRYRAAGAEVALVDRGRLGGLLRSDEVAEGVWVDHGTHVPRETGDPVLDEWLFGDRVDDEWCSHDLLLAGTVFGGETDGRTPFPDLNRIPSDRRRALEEGLLAASGEVEGVTTSEEELDAIFGAAVRQEIFDPLLTRWFGLPSAALAPGAHRIGANRVVAFDAETTAERKAVGPDLALAWHEASTGASPLRAHYPRRGGCGAWIEHLRGRLDGVTVLEETTATLKLEGKRVVGATTSSGDAVDVDLVVNTLPPALLLRSMGEPVAGGPPSFATMALVDVVYDRPFTSDLHYATFLDAGSLGFRVTLYPNLRGAATEGPHAATVEVLGDAAAADVDPLTAAVDAELRAVGIVAADASRSFGSVRRLPQGFPVPVPGAAPAGDDPLAAYPNVVSLGRGSAGKFFLADVLLDAHARLP